MSDRVARVRREGGAGFQAAVANLTGLSCVLVTPEPFSFGETLELELLGVRLGGVVAFVLPAPYQGAVVALAGGLDTRAALEQAGRHGLILGPAAEVMERTTSGVELEAVAEARRQLEQSVDPDSLGGDPDTLKGLEPAVPSVVPEVTEPLPPSASDATVTTQALEDIPLPVNVPVHLDRSPNLYERPPLTVRPKSKKEPEPRPPPTVAGRGAARLDPPTEPHLAKRPVEALPELDRERGLVCFSHAAQFREHYTSSLRHGTLVVRAPPLRLQTLLALAVVVAGQPARVAIQARVAVVGKDGTLGLTLEPTPRHAEELASLAASCA